MSDTTVKDGNPRTAGGGDLAVVTAPPAHGCCGDCGKPTGTCGAVSERSKDGLFVCAWCYSKSFKNDGVYHQDQDQDQDEVLHRGEKGKALISPQAQGATLRPDTGCVELYEWIARYNIGDLDPVDVELGPLPPRQIRHTLRAAHARIALLFGLRLAMDEERPLPLSTSFLAEQLGFGDDRKRASRIIATLVRHGCIVQVGVMKPRGKPDGTRLFTPPGGDAESIFGNNPTTNTIEVMP